MSAGAAPSGVVTFLFTDVEGSTRRWEADADGMRAALPTHDEVLRRAIETNGGFLFKHTGDGVCAAFASPKSAVDAAVAAQRTLELPVRMGIATGEAELRDGDYFGAVLNRVSRVMTAGHGGQILLADSTAGLLSGVDLVDLRPRRLRDLPTPVGVFQVRAEGLRTEFPPLRALDSVPGNLRPATTSFIGRESEVSEVLAALHAHRVVTLTGVGGIGKTRLALEVGRHLTDEFPDGVWVFDLAAVADPAAVPGAVAAVLGITQQPGMSMADSVAAALEGRLRLLVVDNCEHLRDAAADLIEAILAHSATVKFLTTSREGLRIADEQLWLVPSLDVTGGIESTAVTLFVERARRVASRFSATEPRETDAVVEICRRLDGIPLAIELAASRMASLTAGEVRDRLDHRFRLLVGARRGVERHHTLRHAVAWSYDLLDDAEKSLLTRCSVFAGGFDLESACAVAGSDLDDYAVLDLLDALVHKSLLVADRSSGRTRFSMLETIRQFAEEQLVADGAATEVRNAHARYFAEREADILELWDSPDQQDAYDWFGVELANLRTAFRWAADAGDLDVAAPIATCAAFLGSMVENYEPIPWTEELIEPAAAVDHPRLAALYVMATLCWTIGRTDEAAEYAQAGEKVLGGSRAGVPRGFESWLGGVFTNIGQPDRAAAWFRDELLARDRDRHVLTQAALVIALTMAGSHDDAMKAAQGLVEAAEATQNPHVLCFTLLVYGMATCDAEPLRARNAMQRGLLIAHDSGNRYDESHLANILGRLEARYGDSTAALEYLALAVRNYRESGNTTVIRVPMGVLAALLDRLGRHEPAATIAGFAIGTLTTAWTPEFGRAIAHLREVLGDQTYELLAHRGAAMTTATIVTYAYDQIDQARAELKAASE